MRLTDYTDYSLRTLIFVAVHPHELVTIQQIADAFSIPKNHLIKIVQKLGQEGFLHTLRGRAGGLRLGRPASEINIGDVIRTTEPDFGLVECFHEDHNRCVITRVCGLRGVLGAALRAYFDVLDAYTLQDLVEKPAALNSVFDGLATVPVAMLKRSGGTPAIAAEPAPRKVPPRAPVAASKLTSRAVSKPIAKPASKPASKPESKSDAKSGSKPASRPASRPAVARKRAGASGSPEA